MTTKEKIARAMLAAECKDDKSFGEIWTWEDAHPKVKQRLLDSAIAALRALLEPSPAMIEAGRECASGAVFRRMIQAALDEEG